MDWIVLPSPIQGKGTNFHLFKAGSFVCSSKTILKKKKTIYNMQVQN